jgi:SSS family solute:Na+ symporter
MNLIMPSQISINLTFIDWMIFSAVLVMTFAFIVIGQTFFLKKKTRVSNSMDYILMGRTLTLPLFVITLVTSWYGGIFGVTQIAYTQGVYNFVTQGLVWYIGYIMFALVVAKKINKSRVLTMPDKIKQLYGSRAAKLAALLILFKGLPVAYAIGIGLVLKNIFGITLNAGIITGCCFVIAYCSLGGLRAVVLSDIVQFVVMFVAVIIVVLVSVNKFGGSSFLYSNLPESYFSPKGTRHTSDIFVWFFIAISSTIVCPVFYQRCLAAESPNVAYKGVLLSTLFWFIFDICTTVGGMYAKAAMPDLDPVDAYLVYAVEILPIGFKGIFLAGIVATVLSTLDAFTFVTGNIISYDLMPEKWRESNLVRVFSIIAIGIMTMWISLMFDGQMENVWILIEGYSGALLVTPILWSYFVKFKGQDKHFIITCIVSLFVMATYDITVKEQEFRSFYLGTITSLIILATFSLAQMAKRIIKEIK